MKNRLIYIGIALCFALSAHNIYQNFFINKPVASVGECLAIEESKLGHLELKILKNDNKAGISDVIVRVESALGVKITVPVRAKYSELRELGAKKVECSK